MGNDDSYIIPIRTANMLYGMCAFQNASHNRPVLKFRDGTFAWLVDLARGVCHDVCSVGKNKIPSNGYVRYMQLLWYRTMKVEGVPILVQQRLISH